MSKIRIYALARELKLENNQVIELARSCGADVSTASSAIDETIAARIREKKPDPKGRQPARGHGQQRSQQAKQTGEMAEPSQPPAAPAEAPASAKPASSAHAPSSRRQPQGPRAPAQAAAPSPDTDIAPGPASAHGRAAKRYYLVDGLNVCNWQKTPSLAPLVTLLIELKRQGHAFLCIFDANTRFVLEDLGERDKYEHLLNKYDCVGEVPGGTQADDFLLFRAHKTGDTIISNDQYRDQKYRDRYKWLRSVSPRLCKGIVLGGFLILPELDVHARVRDSLASILKEFEEVFGSGAHREQPADNRAGHRAHQRSEPRGGPVPKPERSAPRTEPKLEPKATRAPARTEPPPATTHEQPTSQESPAAAQPTDQSAEPRPRSRRRGRRRGRRGGGGGGVGAGANGVVGGTESNDGNSGGSPPQS